MAANFAFMPAGLTQMMTVGGGTPATISLVVQAVGSTVTTALSGGNYVPRAVRISNDGTAAAFINFGANAATVSVSTSNGLRVRINTDVVLSPGGLPFLAATCASTFTVTLAVTPGEGIA